MTEPRPTASTINDAQLDQLYRERDEARQHAAAIAAQRDRLRQRMNNLADRWDNALAPDKAYARTLRAEISVAPFDPDGAMTVQEYTERGQHLWAFRCWGTETCDGWLGLGHHTQTSALLERERHVAEAHGEPTPAPAEAPEPEETRLAQTRNAATLHRQSLITTAELYAVIEAGPEPAEDLTGYWAPDPPIGCITLAAAPDRLAQSGVHTPGCTCGHEGMGVSWHGDDCLWRCGVLNGDAAELDPKEQP